jgi:hypothetical protein
MDPEKRARLETRGYMVVDDAADWLGLDGIDRQVVEFRVRVGREVRRRLAEAQSAKSVDSLPSRALEFEATADEVGVDLLLRSFFAVGGRLDDLAVLLSEEPSKAKPAEMPKRRKKSQEIGS